MNRISTARSFLSSMVAFARHSRLLTTRSNFPDAKTYKPKRYKLPPFYDPYGPRPPPSDKVLLLAERIASLSHDELLQFGSFLKDQIRAPRLENISSFDPAVAGSVGGATAAVGEEKKVAAEKTVFNVNLEKFDTAAKIKVIKEVRAFTNLGLKEAKELVEKAPVLLKQGITKEEANNMVEKIKSAGGVAVME